MLKFSKQSIDKSDIKAVNKVLNSEYLTQGPKTNEFEKRLKQFAGAKYSIAVNSASSALLISCMALGLQKKDIIWTVPNTFAASANSILLSGQKLDFVDIDKDTWNISLENLKKKLLIAKSKKKLPKALIVVHLAGLPADPIEIKKLAQKYKFFIIEDASHSIGAKYYNKKVGSCYWSDLCVFSFHPVKIITTGEGGSVLTNNKKFYERMLLFKNNGITKNSKKFKNKVLGPWYYEQQVIGYNFRMSDIQAALGINQLKRISKMLKKRNDIAKIYRKKLNNLPLNFQQIRKNFYSSYHLFIIKLHTDNANLHKKLFIFLRKNNIFVNLHYMPLHLNPYYKKFGYKKGNFPNSEDYGKKALSIPIFPDLKKNEQLKVINLLKKFFNVKK